MQKLLRALQGLVAIGGVLLFLGFGIGSTQTVPLFAQVYLDDDTREYFAPPCLSQDSGRRLRSATLRDARDVDYRPNADCRDEGSFVQDGRSLSGGFLERIGILGPLHSRWNADGSWNW
jgi:hypothetical protein